MWTIGVVDSVADCCIARLVTIPMHSAHIIKYTTLKQVRLLSWIRCIVFCSNVLSVWVSVPIVLDNRCSADIGKHMASVAFGHCYMASNNSHESINYDMFFPMTAPDRRLA